MSQSVPMSCTPTPSPIDLSTPQPELRARLDDLIRKEGNLWECGTTCDLKDKAENQSVCLSCPFSMAEVEVTDDMTQEDCRKRLLCRNGREQQTIALTLTIQREHGV